MSVTVASFGITIGSAICGAGVLLLHDRIVRCRRLGVAVIPGWVIASVVALVVFTLLGLALREIPLARSSSHRPSPAYHNLCELHVALRMYYDDWGCFPSGSESPTENLWRLYPLYVHDHRVFFYPPSSVTKPSSPPVVTTGIDGRPHVPPEYLGATDYIYSSDWVDGNPIQLYERGSCRGFSERLVLYLDGNIDGLGERTLQEQLSKQRASRAENAQPRQGSPGR